MAAQTPRPAATVILLREGAGGTEVFMLQRSLKAAFVAGAYVYPGGAIDAEDNDPELVRRTVGLTDREANMRLGVESGGIGFWIAAVRECFEESGILLALDENLQPLDPARVETLAKFRPALNAGDLSFAQFVASERLLLPANTLAYSAHWVTAPGRPRRFDTRFFVACAPHGQDGSHDEGETIHNVWVRPADAIERASRGEIELMFPTRSTLAELARFARPQDAFEHARSLPAVEENRACWAVGADGEKKVFRRADPQYCEIHWCDPEESGDSRYDIVPGLPKRLDRLVTRITAPNPGMMTGPGTNAYLVGGEGDLVLIDPGPVIDSHIEALLAAGAGRIRWVLCTHTHVDHSPAAGAIQAATGAQLIGMPPPPGQSQDQTFAPARIPAHGERLDFGGFALRAVHTPGHASNQLCYLLEQTKLLFSGDHVMQGSTVVIGPPDGDMRAYLRSLEALLDLDLAAFAPGHGYLIGDPHKEVRRLVAHRLGREAKVRAALARIDNATLEELVPVVYDDVSSALHRVASRSLAAHLDKLLAEGEAQLIDGRYSRAA